MAMYRCGSQNNPFFFNSIIGGRHITAPATGGSANNITVTGAWTSAVNEPSAYLGALESMNISTALLCPAGAIVGVGAGVNNKLLISLATIDNYKYNYLNFAYNWDYTNNDLIRMYLVKSSDLQTQFDNNDVSVQNVVYEFGITTAHEFRPLNLMQFPKDLYELVVFAKGAGQGVNTGQTLYVGEPRVTNEIPI